MRRCSSVHSIHFAPELLHSNIYKFPLAKQALSQLPSSGLMAAFQRDKIREVSSIGYVAPGLIPESFLIYFFLGGPSSCSLWNRLQPIETRISSEAQVHISVERRWNRPQVNPIKRFCCIKVTTVTLVPNLLMSVYPLQHTQSKVLCGWIRKVVRRWAEQLFRRLVLPVKTGRSSGLSFLHFCGCLDSWIVLFTVPSRKLLATLSPTIMFTKCAID